MFQKLLLLDPTITLSLSSKKRPLKKKQAIAQGSSDMAFKITCASKVMDVLVQRLV